MNYRDVYTQWCTDSYFDENTKAELKALEGDEKEIHEYKVEQLRFKRRHGKKDKNIQAEDKALKELENLEKKEGKSKLNDD